MQKLACIFFVILSFSCLMGCASVLNPYDSDVSCPQADKGKCMGVYDAYDMSVKTSGKSIREPKANKYLDKAADKDVRTDGDNLYQKDLYDKMAGLIRAPKTPMLMPEKLVRGLFLPIEGEDEELYMEEYVYLKIDKSHYILSPAVQR